MKNKIKEFFEDADFIVSETDFGTLPVTDTLRSVVLEKNGQSPVASFLCSYPDLFIFPRKIPAVKGCFFGVIAPTGNVDKQRVQILIKHFPVDRVAVFTESEKTIKVHWMKDGPRREVDLDKFLGSLG